MINILQIHLPTTFLLSFYLGKIISLHKYIVLCKVYIVDKNVAGVPRLPVPVYPLLGEIVDQAK